jgi:hypothetical protein
MSLYIVTSNGENVDAYSTKDMVIENLKQILDDDNGSGWTDSYHNDTFKSFIKGEYELPIGGSMHVEGGVLRDVLGIKDDYRDRGPRIRKR